MTVIQFPRLCKRCGKRLKKCVCFGLDDDLLWKAVETIDLSKGYTLDEFIEELERKLNDE